MSKRRIKGPAVIRCAACGRLVKPASTMTVAGSWLRNKLRRVCRPCGLMDPDQHRQAFLQEGGELGAGD